MSDHAPKTPTQEEWNELAERFSSPSGFVAVVDHDFIVRATCQRSKDEIDYSFADLVGQSAAAMIHPTDVERALHGFSQATTHSGLRPPDVYQVRVGANKFRRFDVSGENIDIMGGVVIFRIRELTDRRRAEMLAIEQIEILESLGDDKGLDHTLRLVASMAERHIPGSACIISMVCETGGVRSIRPQFSELAINHDWEGVSPSELGPNVEEARKRGISFIETGIGEASHWEHLADRIQSVVTTPATDPSGSFVGVVEIFRTSSEQPDNAELSVHLLVARLVGLLRDRFRVATHLADAAYTDPLTGLGNRRRFTQALAKLDDSPDPYTVFAIDLDQFTWINNNLGHMAGDEILRQVAERFTSILSKNTPAFRQGGDEFAVLIPTELTDSQILAIGRRLSKSLHKPCVLDMVEKRVRASIGIATRRPGEPYDLVLSRADAAMYSAKAEGGSGVRLYDDETGGKVLRRIALSNDLQKAIENDELTLVYQPKFDLRTRDIVGVEALVRWEHPEHGLLPPNDFVPLAEESHLILELDHWVRTAAYAQLQKWLAARPPTDPVNVWVNLSARSLDQADLVSSLVQLTGGDPNPCLGLELTERDGFKDLAKAKGVFRDLAEAGFKLALDDFGMGRASLQHLAELDVSAVKIDRTFVNKMAHSYRYRVMVESILSVGRALGLTVVAEGIETKEQLASLQGLGCERGQGYLMSRPMLPETLENLFGPGLTGRWDPLMRSFQRRRSDGKVAQRGHLAITAPDPSDVGTG